MNDHAPNSVVCFGEVLWDILPTAEVPGGAPMNVTYHLQKLQKNPALITRIGNDEKGRLLTELFTKFGVCQDFFQRDDVHETGKVYATPNEHDEMVYDIVKPVAWDFIGWSDSLQQLVSKADYFVFGSLAARSDTSKNTLLKLLESARKKVFDINLRPPHFDKKTLEELLFKSDFLKINLAELRILSGWYFNYGDMQDAGKAIMEKFQVPDMVLTLGADGAILFHEGKLFVDPGFKVTVNDTIGSGDAFLAGFLSKWMDAASPEKALEFASALGAFVATKTGGCPEYTMEEVNTFLAKHSGQHS